MMVARKDRSPSESRGARKLLSWKSKAALAAGVAAPLGMILAADPAAAVPDSGASGGADFGGAHPDVKQSLELPETQNRSNSFGPNFEPEPGDDQLDANKGFDLKGSPGAAAKITPVSQHQAFRLNTDGTTSQAPAGSSGYIPGDGDAVPTMASAWDDLASYLPWVDNEESSAKSERAEIVGDLKEARSAARSAEAEAIATADRAVAARGLAKAAADAEKAAESMAEQAAEAVADLNAVVSERSEIARSDSGDVHFDLSGKARSYSDQRGEAAMESRDSLHDGNSVLDFRSATDVDGNGSQSFDYENDKWSLTGESDVTREGATSGTYNVEGADGSIHTVRVDVEGFDRDSSKIVERVFNVTSVNVPNQDAVSVAAQLEAPNSQESSTIEITEYTPVVGVDADGLPNFETVKNSAIVNVGDIMQEGAFGVVDREVRGLETNASVFHDPADLDRIEVSFGEPTYARLIVGTKGEEPSANFILESPSQADEMAVGYRGIGASYVMSNKDGWGNQNTVWLPEGANLKVATGERLGTEEADESFGAALTRPKNFEDVSTRAEVSFDKNSFSVHKLKDVEGPPILSGTVQTKDNAPRTFHLVVPEIAYPD